MRDARSVSVIFAVALSLAPGTFGTRPGIAGTQDEALLVLHAKSHTVKATTTCTTWAPTIPCSQYITSWPVGENCDIYLVVARAEEGPGISGLSCGLEYDTRPGFGADVFGYTLCADFDSPSAGLNGMWPASGGGNRIGWDPATHCQRTVIAPDGVHAVACSFYVYAYSPDDFLITYNFNLPTGLELTVTDCAESITRLPTSCMTTPGFVGFGLRGCNPCTDSPCWICGATEPETWSGLKARY